MVDRLRWPSWFLPDHARPLPTLFTLTQRPSNDLTRLPNALSTTALHSRPLPIVLNSSKQPGTVGDTSTKFTDLPGPSKTHPRSFPTFLRLHKTSPDHQGRERSAVRSAKCDRGLKDMSLVITVPADGLASNSAGPSAGTVLTKIHTRWL